MLDIAGHNVGFVKKFSGLNLEGTVVEHDLGPENVVKKNIGTIKPTEAKVTMGIAMGKGMYEWIKLAFDKKYEHRSGAFTSADFDYRATSTLTFHDALITSVTVPKLDGGSKENAYFDIGFDAERIEWAKAGNESLKSKVAPRQKAWLCCNFRVEVDGFEKALMDQVATVESFTWKCSVVRDQVGATQWSAISPAKVTVPEVKFSIGYNAHDAWAKWAKEWFVSGERRDENEKNGRIVFLGPDMQEELGSVDLIHCGLAKFEDAESTANSETIKRFTVTLYVEEMKFNLKYTDA